MCARNSNEYDLLGRSDCRTRGLRRTCAPGERSPLDAGRTKSANQVQRIHNQIFGQETRNQQVEIEERNKGSLIIITVAVHYRKKSLTVTCVVSLRQTSGGEGSAVIALVTATLRKIVVRLVLCLA